MYEIPGLFQCFVSFFLTFPVSSKFPEWKVHSHFSRFSSPNGNPGATSLQISPFLLGHGVLHHHRIFLFLGFFVHFSDLRHKIKHCTFSFSKSSLSSNKLEDAFLTDRQPVLNSTGYLLTSSTLFFNSVCSVCTALLAAASWDASLSFV